MAPQESILCIPGDWTDRHALLERIIRDSDGYLCLGPLLMHMETKDKFELQFEEFDTRMTSAFASAGRHWEGTDDMDRIATHASVVYLIGEGGSRASAERLMLAGEGLLKAGGLGVKVESSGVAHSPRAWRGLVAARHLFGVHDAFVLYVRGAHVYSCGMHHFGLPEAMVDEADVDDAAELLRTFTRYLLDENPTIRAGQTFATAADAPVFRIVEGVPIDYDADSLFRNPHGMWRLELIRPDVRPRKAAAWWRGMLN
ncbi:DUF4261 domain-containing protein [Pseudoduganella lutea]|nr:DUF4261 domain-containing protein [Pseudoduganella lutea]